MRIILGCSLLLATGFATAGGIPTVDVPALIQSTKTYVQDKKTAFDAELRAIEEIRELYSHGVKLQSQIDSLNGDYAMGYLLDTPAYRYKRRRIARSFDGIKEGLGTAEEFSERHGVPQDRSRQYITNLAVWNASEKQLARADDRIDNAEAFIDEIDNDPDTKAALDLNNRLLAEILISMAEDEKTRVLTLQAENDRQLEELLRRESDLRMSR